MIALSHNRTRIAQTALQRVFAIARGRFGQYQRRRFERQAIAELSDHLLRDAGLEHLITGDQNMNSLHRYL